MEENINQKGNTILAVIIAIVITALLVGGGVYVWQKRLMNSNNLTKQNNQQINKLDKEQEQAEGSKAVDAKVAQQEREQDLMEVKTSQQKRGQSILGDNTTSAKDSDTSTKNVMTNAGWKIYKNKEYGYSIQYPKKWVLEETSRPAAFDKDLQARYIGIKSLDADDDYFYLQIGVKKKGQNNVILSERTGVGAVKLVKGNILLGNKYNVDVYMGKNNNGNEIVDIIGENTVINSEYIAQVSIAYFGINPPSGTKFNIVKTKEYEIIKQILATFKFNKQ